MKTVILLSLNIRWSAVRICSIRICFILIDLPGDFKLLVLNKFDEKVMDVIEWWAPRLICIGSDFRKFDNPAIKQKSLETLSWYATFCLVMIFCYWDFWPRYRPKLIDEKPSKPRKLHTYKTITELLADASSELTALSVDLDGFWLNMGMMWPKKDLDFNLFLDGLKVPPVSR